MILQPTEVFARSCDVKGIPGRYDAHAQKGAVKIVHSAENGNARGEPCFCCRLLRQSARRPYQAFFIPHRTHDRQFSAFFHPELIQEKSAVALFFCVGDTSPGIRIRHKIPRQFLHQKILGLTDPHRLRMMFSDIPDPGDRIRDQMRVHHAYFSDKTRSVISGERFRQFFCPRTVRPRNHRIRTLLRFPEQIGSHLRRQADGRGILQTFHAPQGF